MYQSSLIEKLGTSFSIFLTFPSAEATLAVVEFLRFVVFNQPLLLLISIKGSNDFASF